MKHLHSLLVIITAATCLMAVAGCGTPAPTGSRQTPLAGDKEARTPFLERGDYPERLEGAMTDVLYAHRFSVPWIVVRGSDASIWFVAERLKPRPEDSFDRVYVQVTPEERVTASITAYQYGPSDWAILGRLSVDFRPEAESIAAEIAKRLSGDGHPVR